MPKNISFSLTTDQIRDQSKTVTRRVGWWKNKNGNPLAKVGDTLNACVKCMGLKPGEKIEVICQIRITGLIRERLGRMDNEPYGHDEAVKEGFPEMSGYEFVEMFCGNMKVKPDREVTRIEFEYLKAGDEN